jgi:hypothetical protein
MRIPGQHQPDPPGGRAAARLREFLGARFGSAAEWPPGAGPEPEPAADREKPAEAEAANEPPSSD